MAIEQMDQEDDIRDELGSLSPLIPAKKVNMPPPEYFETMPERVIQRWKGEVTRVHHRKVLVRRWMAIAAISIGALFGGWWMINQAKSPISNPALALNSAEAYQYVMDNISDFDGLMEQHVPWPKEEKIIVPDSSAAEEYLLEELQGNDIEQIF